MRHLATRSNRTIPIADSFIAAGAAIEVGDAHTLLDINQLITGGRDGYIAFEVTGDSATPNIQPGNIVFVDTWAQPVNGQFVAATVNGLTCVKEFQHSRCGLYLVSKNTDYKPREITERDAFHVLGVVKGHLVLYP